MICGEISSPSLKTVKNSNSRCRYCRGLKVTSEAAIEDMHAVGLLPLEEYVSTHHVWKCRCTNCGRIARVSHSKAKSRGQGCSFCNEVRPLLDLEKLAKEIDELGFELFAPLSRSSNSNQARHRKCGKTVTVNYKNVGRGIGLCKWCAPNAPIDEANALIIMKEAGYTPIEDFRSNASKWKSIHEKCGNQVSPTLKQIRNGIGGCKYCANWGFNYGDAAIVYLITHRQLSAHKIGISNPNAVKSADRLQKHQREGWEVVEIWNFENGKTAEEVETEVLRELRINRQIPPFLTKAEMKQSGHTETVGAQQIELEELAEIIRAEIRKVT